jgi:hypothetical protein
MCVRERERDCVCVRESPCLWACVVVWFALLVARLAIPPPLPLLLPPPPNTGPVNHLWLAQLGTTTTTTTTTTATTVTYHIPLYNLSLAGLYLPTVLTTTACRSPPIRLASPSSSFVLALPSPPSPYLAGPGRAAADDDGHTIRPRVRTSTARPTLWPSHLVSRSHPATPFVPPLNPSWGATRTIESVDFDWPCPHSPGAPTL